MNNDCSPILWILFLNLQQPSYSLFSFHFSNRFTFNANRIDFGRELLIAIISDLKGVSIIFIDNVRFLEKAYNKTDSKFSKKNALPILECFLNGNKSFSFAGRQFESPKDLAAYLQTFADTSKSALSRTIQPLFQDEFNFDPRFEAWITMRFFDTLNKVESKLNKQMESMSKP